MLAAAEVVFARYGYTEASIVRITEEAGVGQGTFYLYFSSKLEIFEELGVFTPEERGECYRLFKGR